MKNHKEKKPFAKKKKNYNNPTTGWRSLTARFLANKKTTTKNKNYQ